MEIENKVAIVTGGSGGIGFSTVQALLKNGAQHVAIFDNDPSKNKNCLDKLNEEFVGERVSVHTCDVTNSTKFSELYDAVVESQKNVDILINCAGVLCDRQPNLAISVNLTATIKNSLIAMDRMGKHKKGRGGTILNVASIVGLMCNVPIYPIYTATKHGVISFTVSLMDHYNKTGVRALVLCPGPTKSPMVESVPAMQKATLEFIDEEFFHKSMSVYSYYQPPENVAEAAMKMIKIGKPGDVWVSEENEPAYAVQEPAIYKERKVPV